MFAICFCFSMILGIHAKDFLINTEECHMPYFDAFSEEANRTYALLRYADCTKKPLLTYTSVENNMAYLHIKTENIDKYYSSKEKLDCHFSYVTREGTSDEPDVGIRIHSSSPFNSTVHLLDYIVLIKCYNSGVQIYEEVHSPIVATESVKQKIKKPESTTNKPLSVLFIVIDSIARLNLIRTMPETRNFLLENDFVEFESYNKIGDNTFPNFMAFLTGLNLNQSDATCQPDKVGMLDRCPMIWYDFRKEGYVTAYAEDWESITTFNYLKKGFLNPPTDYYYKPYFEAAEKLKTIKKDTMPYCAGPETEGERILNLARDFTSTFKTHPSFGIFWMNTFSHNDVNAPSRMDGKMKEFFQDIKEGGILNESVVIYLSDHGIRFGDIRKTIQGWYEERLPMNLISLPPWFRETYPEKYENFKENSKKLTSTYDLYMTLREILAMATGKQDIPESKGCPTCISLFSQISETRSCEQAGIPEIWCTCLGRFKTISNESEYAEVIDKASQIISKELKASKENSPTYHLMAINKNSTEYTHLLMILKTSNGHFHEALFRLKNNPLDIGELLMWFRLY